MPRSTKNSYFKSKICFAAVLLLFFFCFLFPFSVKAAVSFREQLRQKMADIQKQIDQYENKIQTTRQKSDTLQRQIDLLNQQMGQLKLKLKQTELSIDDLGSSIEDKNKEIADIEVKLNEKKKLLVEYIQTIYQYDQENLLEIVLKEDNFSDFFDAVNNVQKVEEKIGQVFQVIKDLKDNLEAQKNNLQSDLDEQNQLKNLQEAQRVSLEKQGKEKTKLLVTTQGQEKNYQKSIEKARTDIAAIRNQLYLLENVGISMTLEQAAQYANAASSRTGVRSAFLLAVLKNESSWGTKVGTGTWKKDMHSRDRNAFLQITQELGMDPDTTPVSKKPSYGWGGAMGPAQFLPSVWLLVKEEVGQLTSHIPPNPWHIDDAFMAAAVKLKRAGANAQTYDAEWKAAMIYFAGGNWNKPAYKFYGNTVMEMAQAIQEQLDLMK